MKGLILNDIYSIQRDIKSSIIFSVACVIFLILTKNVIAFKVAVFLPFLIIPVKSFEVLKYDVKSGWEKFMITLPVTRTQIVQSKYITFLILLILSLLLSLILFFAVDILYYPTFTLVYYNHLLRGMGLIICVAALLYPMTYKLGIEKSDSIILYSLCFSFGVFFFLAMLAKMILAENRNADMIFSIVFFLVSIFLLIISYLVACMIVARKEY
ncbi:ABC-2 transporter permease [Bacillus andreraoultii]|uniref:ABC-2 transporter permease n=1 Tax=Bacillus andreraoultii TaxID=1499685 RepID=UPI000539FEF6|nr:ABC-2 transporter permease [Bacillus andreraoultii]